MWTLVSHVCIFVLCASCTTVVFRIQDRASIYIYVDTGFPQYDVICGDPRFQCRPSALRFLNPFAAI